jgi:hypothetical protein
MAVHAKCSTPAAHTDVVPVSLLAGDVTSKTTIWLDRNRGVLPLPQRLELVSAAAAAASAAAAAAAAVLVLYSSRP